MHSTHVRVDRDPDPLSVNARVNATRIAISILVGRRSRIFALCKRSICPASKNLAHEKGSYLKLPLLLLFIRYLLLLMSSLRLFLYQDILISSDLLPIVYTLK